MNALFKKSIFFALLLPIGISCDKTEDKSEHLVCNRLLGSCGQASNVEYCTFGYKFGDSNPYSPSGPQISGPALGTSSITFRFKQAGFSFNTHSQANRSSYDFDDVEKSAIRNMLSQWENVAAFNLVEKSADEDTDVTIIKGDIQQAGLGYPAFVINPCLEVSGFLILSVNSPQRVRLSLHEMGHVLGLGHVSSENVMNPNTTYDFLQPGDIAGIQSIYGRK